MNAPERWDDARTRSLIYREFARAFSYAGAGSSPYAIEGADYNAAFDPSVNKSACSLREGAHIDSEQSALFEELARFYGFFGLARNDTAEMPDHLSVELEFLHYLTHIEAEAMNHGFDTASVCRAQHDFISRHVQRILDALRAKLDARHESCSELVEDCSDFIALELTRLDATIEHGSMKPGGDAA